MNTSSLRVLVLFGGIPLYGQERANLGVFTSLREAGVEALFLTNAEHGFKIVEPELDALGLTHRPALFGPVIGSGLDLRGWWRVLRGVVGTNLSLLRAIWQFEPTHLHVMNPLYAIYASPLLFVCRLPLIYRIGDAPPVQSRLYRWFWGLLSRRITLLVANARYVVERCVAAGFPAEKIRHIYSTPRAAVPRPTGVVALPVSHYHEDWRERGTVEIEPDASLLTVVYCGQLQPAKGWLLAVEAVESLLRAGKAVRLLLGGDYTYRNPEAQAVKARIEEAGLADRIVFLGYVDDSPALFSLADVHVCPSLWQEPLANTVLEAKAAGVPSIIFPNGGLPETVTHEVDGQVCHEQTSEGLAKALEFYLNDPASLHAHGQAARQSATGTGRFGPEEFRERWLRIFRSTLHDELIADSR